MINRFGVGMLLSLSLLRCGTGAPQCLRGDTRACLGPGRCEGAQRCLDDDLGFGVCECVAPSPDAGVGGTAGGSAQAGGAAGGLSDVGKGGGSAVAFDSGVAGGGSATTNDAGVAVACAVLPAPWTRGALQRVIDVPAVEIRGATLNPFPNSGMTGTFRTRDDEYLAVEFTTPSSVADWESLVVAKLFDWQEAQIGGAAILGRTFVTIRSCPGDFRIAPAGQTAPGTDPTFARGCSNFRPTPPFAAGPRNSIPYVIDTAPSDDTTCRLAPGRRYFINLVRADVRDGLVGPPAMEASCGNPELSACGVQMRIH
ncbi:MAG: hypothetical protein Q8S33_02320 [Myxococcales bacterium]|nr:hypothetical protein [Myxococcales bacterium]